MTKRELPYIAVALRRARNEAGLTQHQLAADADVSRPTIAGIEGGTHKTVKIKTVIKLATALQIPVMDLVGPSEFLLRSDAEEFLKSPLAQMLNITPTEREWLDRMLHHWPKGDLTPTAFFHLVEALRH